GGGLRARLRQIRIGCGFRGAAPDPECVEPAPRVALPLHVPLVILPVQHAPLPTPTGPGRDGLFLPSAARVPAPERRSAVLLEPQSLWLPARDGQESRTTQVPAG